MMSTFFLFKELFSQSFSHWSQYFAHSKTHTNQITVDRNQLYLDTTFLVFIIHCSVCSLITIYSIDSILNGHICTGMCIYRQNISEEIPPLLLLCVCKSWAPTERNWPKHATTVNLPHSIVGSTVLQQANQQIKRFILGVMIAACTDTLRRCGGFQGWIRCAKGVFLKIQGKGECCCTVNVKFIKNVMLHSACFGGCCASCTKSELMCSGVCL